MNEVFNAVSVSGLFGEISTIIVMIQKFISVDLLSYSFVNADLPQKVKRIYSFDAYSLITFFLIFWFADMFITVSMDYKRKWI